MKTLVAAVVLSTSFVYAKPVKPTLRGSDEQRVVALIKQMTLKEKVSMVSGNDPRTNPVPRLNIPSIVMNDGPLGVRSGHSTAFPSGLAIGASFDSSLAEEEGEAIADEAKTKGINMMLGPCVNIARQPFGGRNFESYGEDPLLSSVLAASYISGMQSRGVIATVKHFAVNDQEFERKISSSKVDTRTLFEIHFPMFKAAVDAGVLSVMSSYNRVNGTYASENSWLLTRVLKDLWGFKGFVVSDWTSTHSTIALANAGLDLEMPTGEFFGAKLESAVIKGQVSEKVLDDKVRRLLRAMYAIGLMGDKKMTSQKPLGADSQAHQLLARTLAEEGTVLLKNDGLLPLQNLKSIAVIGPHAARLRTGGGGSSKVVPFEAVSPLDALKAETTAKINYAEGTLVEGDVGVRITAKDFKGGKIRADYFRTIDDLNKKSWTTRTEPQIELSNDPKLDDRFGVRFSGELVAPVTGEVTFSAANSHTTRLWIDGKRLISNTASGDTEVDEVNVAMIKGRAYKFVLESGRGDDDTETTLQVGWRLPNPNRLAEAVAAAKASDAAVLFIGLGNEMESEGQDRASLDLPKDQLELLNAVTAVNPHTVVVLTGGGVITMPWLSKVSAVMQAWYPGSEGGRALARLLTGAANPSGKLPISYIKRWEDSSAYGRYPGVNHEVAYSEGIFVGYRFLDRVATAPLFPFGFGLSYSTFAIRNLKTVVSDASAANPRVLLTFDVSNTGSRDGAEVAQVYVGEKNPSLPRPVRELKGFARVQVKAGETKTVTLALDKSAFAFFDVASMSWKVNPAAFEISLGSSSRDLADTQTIQLQ